MPKTKEGGQTPEPLPDWDRYFEDLPEEYAKYWLDRESVKQADTHLQRILSFGHLTEYQDFLHMLAGIGLAQLSGLIYKPKAMIRAFGEWYVDPDTVVQLRDGTVEVAEARISPMDDPSTTYLYDIRNPRGLFDGRVVVEVEGNYEGATPEIFVIDEANTLTLVAMRKNDIFLEREAAWEAKIARAMQEGLIPRLS